MIKKLLVQPDDVSNNASLLQAAKKINELIEASNRQDRVSAWLLEKSPHYRKDIIADIGAADYNYYIEKGKLSNALPWSNLRK